MGPKHRYQRIGISIRPPIREIRRLGIAALSTGLIAAGCASDPLLKFSVDVPPTVLAPAETAGVTDGRGRFREILCAVNEARGREFPDYRPCEEVLWRVTGEPDATGDPVHLDRSRSELRLLVVPGLGWECLENFLAPDFDGFRNLRSQGFYTEMVPVEGLAGSARNAQLIRDAILDREDLGAKKLVLVGYSKGAPDILEAIGRYPEIHPYVAAVVSASGAIGGSPLADDASESTLDLLTGFPGATCKQGDGMAIDSLKQSTRLRWLAEHPLPDDIASFSLVSFADRGDISKVLLPTYDQLAQVDPRNDSQLIFYNQIIPGGDLLGYLRADHWAVAVPIARKHTGIVTSLVDHNAFPREVVLEAVARYVDERLGGP